MNILKKLIFVTVPICMFFICRSISGNIRTNFQGETVSKNCKLETITPVTGTSSLDIMPVITPLEPKNLEDYVKGVVAAEMPVSFNIEALKAQAVASRTYAYRTFIKNSSISYNNIGQAYITTDTMKKRWGRNFDTNYKKISQAVDSTKGQILIYNNEAILAVFSSASGGKTESSKNMWGSELPYLKTVDSSLDEKAPVFYDKKEFSLKELENITGIKGINKNNTYVIQRSDADYVLKLCLGGKEINGSQFRSMLGLRSGNFTLEFNNNKLTVTTKGYGHGVGMSQYGAGYMAENGSNYKDILFHYYSGTSLGYVGMSEN